jgi:hypothetical protein
LGFSTNFVGSESGQIQSVKLLKNMVSNRTPLHTVFERGELNQREGERGNRAEYRSHCRVENSNMTECSQEIGYLQSMNSDKHLPQSSFAGQYF